MAAGMVSLSQAVWHLLTLLLQVFELMSMMALTPLIKK